MAVRTKPELIYCEHDLLVERGNPRACADCSGLSVEVAEAIQADQRTVVAIVSRKRGSFPQPRQAGYRGGADVNRRWVFK